jgi:hypothetical protein
MPRGRAAGIAGLVERPAGLRFARRAVADQVHDAERHDRARAGTALFADRRDPCDGQDRIRARSAGEGRSGEPGRQSVGRRHDHQNLQAAGRADRFCRRVAGGQSHRGFYDRLRPRLEERHRPRLYPAGRHPHAPGLSQAGIRTGARAGARRDRQRQRRPGPRRDEGLQPARVPQPSLPLAGERHGRNLGQSHSGGRPKLLCQRIHSQSGDSRHWSAPPRNRLPSRRKPSN